MFFLTVLIGRRQQFSYASSFLSAAVGPPASPVQAIAGSSVGTQPEFGHSKIFPEVDSILDEEKTMFYHVIYVVAKITKMELPKKQGFELMARPRRCSQAPRKEPCSGVRW